MKTYLTITLLLVFCCNLSAFFKESEADIAGKEITKLKQNYQHNSKSPETIRHEIKEIRRQRNSKVRNVIEYAKSNELSAAWLMKSIENGAISQDLVKQNRKEFENRQQASFQTKPLFPVPVKMAIIMGVFSIIGLTYLKIKKAIKNI